MARNRSKNKAPQPEPQPSEASSSSADPSKWQEMGENGREIEKSNLSFRQQATLPIIAASPTIAQATRSSGIGETTLYRWLEDDEFREELTRLRQESAELARHEIKGLMLTGASVIAEAMEAPDMAIRLRAARYAMSFAVQIGEAENLRKEIQALEEAVRLNAVSVPIN